jgi:hypothetical protein
MPSRSHLLAALFVLAILWPAGARAHPDLDAAEERLQQADFAGAVRALDAAEGTETGLSREEVVQLYSRRALAHLALGDPARMEEDLVRLFALEPEHVFGPETRPEIREAFARTRAEQEPLTLRVTHRAEPGGLVVEAVLSGDPTGLVRTVRLAGRRSGAEWVRGEGESLVVPLSAGSDVEYYAEAIGPGGAVLVAEGSELQPRRASFGGGAGGEGGGPPPGGGDDDSVVLWVVVGAVGVALLVGAIILFATVGGGSDATQPDPPVIFPSM